MSLAYGNAGAEICVVGRVAPATGIGNHTYAMCEMLSRSFATCILPTEYALRPLEVINLPNGREIPVFRPPQEIKVWVFVDVLWNGQSDGNYDLVPASGLRIAYVVFDSDELPVEWVDILNNRFDICLTPTSHLTSVFERSGVTIPIGVLPLALDLEPLLSQPSRPHYRGKTKFLSIAAFHPRKKHDTLIRAFVDAFGAREDVELHIHSNLDYLGTAAKLSRLVEGFATANIILTTDPLTEIEKQALIADCDVFVNCSAGEAYSIGAREALALGKLLVLSGVGGHTDLAGCPGVWIVEPIHHQPAYYPEIDHRISGKQEVVSARDVAQALFSAKALCNAGEDIGARSARRRRSAFYTFSNLWQSYAEVLDPGFYRYRSNTPINDKVTLPPAFRDEVAKKIGVFGAGLKATSRRIIQVHDGGFYSIFNTFFSHLVWDQKDERCRLTLPDWDAGRMIRRLPQGKKVTSFCYSKPTDGNLWVDLFEPLFGLSADDLNSENFLYHNAVGPDMIFNNTREPLLTYVHAYRLYRSPSFAAWRRQYHSVFQEHVRLLPRYQKEIDDFVGSFLNKPLMVAAHVRHPSHSLEQPGSQIAHAQSYVDRVHREVSARGVGLKSDDWGVFLATDQDQVVETFRRAFGDKLCCFADVRRTSATEDQKYLSQPTDALSIEGHQIQHLMAQDTASWSVRLAWEIVRDAHVMSRCDVLLHVVSNVSTAVSYMNPEIDLVFTH